MILRRVIEHVKAQNWTAIALDFVIVVMGVFIGIQVSNWNEVRQEEREARQYIDRIQKDLLNNQEDFETRRQYFTRIKFHALRALNALDGPREALDEQFIVDSFIASFSLKRPIGSDTYDELLSVGAVNTIGDISVRERLAEYYRGVAGSEYYINEIPAYRDVPRRAIPYEVQALLRSGGCYVNVNSDETGSPTALAPEDCPLELADEQLSSAIDNLLAANLKPELTRALATFDLTLFLLQTQSDRAQNLYDYLEEAN
jgi:hypothetical protein